MNDDGLTLGAAVAWGVLFLVFVAMTDIAPLATMAAAFAWLLFVSILFRYGAAAFDTIRTVNTTRATVGTGPTSQSGV